MSLHLNGRSVVRLRRAAGTRIQCRAGLLWVSEYQRADDSVLRAGQALTVGSDCDVVLSGLPDAQVALVSQPAGHLELCP
ncbi:MULTISPECIES: DUF2917 domain-containing protein [unclassified Achromobacter]|uniref:DUF2917 domain-containing protein n=1 Tax=unclassified Achromobacter TaxID=2626865 RepID=UPI0009EA6B4C|nr:MULTISPECIES: DUF2917 domain-containing protein [unclassified Achromobacter]